MKKTALYDQHKELKAKLVPFGGWEMPIQYEGVLAEHKQVRNEAGLFDVSHMGEIKVMGPDAEKFLNSITINNIKKLSNGEGQYTALPNEKGGFVDDLIIYRLEDNNYLLCVNASNTEKDFDWISSQTKDFDVNVTNESELWSQLALQGPKTMQVLKDLFDWEVLDSLNYMNIAEVEFAGGKLLLARTGYTGEVGVELYIPNTLVVDLFAKILSHNDVKPIGLGARDTLRLEACYLLYGNDMNDDVSPVEAGISWAVDWDKDFIGKEVLEKHRLKETDRRKMIAFELQDKGIARAHMEVMVDDNVVGEVTSGSFLPTLEKAGGMALINKNAAKVGDIIQINVRGKKKLAKVVKRPLYSARVK